MPKKRSTSKAIRVRREYIVEQVARTGEVDVAKIAGELGVSQVTVRRDLSYLDSAGLVRRIHGGAILRPSPDSRSRRMTAEKAAIASAVAAMVSPGDVVGVDVGSTCMAVATALAQRDDLTILTNSMQVALVFRDSQCRVLVPGGRMTSEGSLVGGILGGNGARLHVDKLVLGCGGLSARHGVSYHDMDETLIRRSLLDWSECVILATDHTKFDQVRPFVLGDLDLIDRLVTNRQPSGELGSAIKNAGVDLYLTE